MIGSKTSPNGFPASKCDVGNWIFSKSSEFLGNFLGIFGEFLGFLWEVFRKSGNSLEIFGNSLEIFGISLGIHCAILRELSMSVYIFKSQLVSYIFSQLIVYIFKVS